MKIIIKSKKVEPKIIINNIEPGVVFKYSQGVTALKLQNGEVALLQFSSGSDWFEISDGSMDYRGIEILGKLDEITVVEE